MVKSDSHVALISSDEYIKERILPQIDFYDRKSIKNQKIYRFLMTVSIIASALIPIFSLISDTSLLIKIVISILGASVSIIISIISLYKFHELWVLYRTNCETLKSTLYQFKAKSGVFHNLPEAESFHLLVKTCEDYFVKEFTSWQALQSQSSSESNS